VTPNTPTTQVWTAGIWFTKDNQAAVMADPIQINVRSKTTLLSLPPELRLQIYEFVMDESIEWSTAPLDLSPRSHIYSIGTDKPTLHHHSNLNLIHLNCKIRSKATPLVGNFLLEANLRSREMSQHIARAHSAQMNTPAPAGLFARRSMWTYRFADVRRSIYTPYARTSDG